MYMKKIAPPLEKILGAPLMSLYVYGLFSDQKGGNKLLSVAEISARQVLCCYQMLLPDGAGVARSLSLRLDATR